MSSVLVRGAGTLLQDIMSKDVTLTTPDTTLDELKSQFGAMSGLPVVKSKKDKTLVGVVSKKDLLKRGDCVQDVRSTLPTVGPFADSTLHNTRPAFVLRCALSLRCTCRHCMRHASGQLHTATLGL